jgi:N-acetylglutamate synthase-like GNAT family acetyltransferase
LTLGFGEEKGAWIATFAVHPRYMGQGIGAFLAEETFKVYRDQGITSVFTSVKWDSTDLLSFFRRLDFERSDFINLAKKLS